MESTSAIVLGVFFVSSVVFEAFVCRCESHTIVAFDATAAKVRTRRGGMARCLDHGLH